MKPYFEESAVTIFKGHAIEVLKTLPDEYVQMAITSPPYYGLRNYAGGTDIVWGEDGNCEHEWTEETQGLQHENRNNLRGTQEEVVGKTGTAFIQKYDRLPAGICVKCGRWRGQLGLEPNVGLYISHLMMIFREVKRVLRKDGSFYLNIGDTYFSNPSNQQGHGFGKSGAGARAAFENLGRQKRIFTNGILKPKCMICVPERVMFAMIEDGWILRNKIIWHKPNSMPSSVKDRFTTTWEYMYFWGKNSNTILWRNRETGEWRDTRPTKDENYPWGGIYQHKETGEFSWTKPSEKDKNNWIKYQPLWMGFDHYFDLDAVRVPHKTLSLERYQRGVNLDRPAIGKSAEVGPMQQYPRYPQWFGEQFPPDEDYKGKFDELFGHGPTPQSFNLRVRDVKRGKGGATAQGGELKASQKEIEEYEYPEKLTKHDQAVGRTGDVVEAYDSKYLGSNYGQPLQGFQRDQTIEKAREQSRKDAEELYPDDLKRQQEYINFIHDHKSHPKGKNPGDVIQATSVRHKSWMSTPGHPYTHKATGKPQNPGDYWELTTQPYKGAHFAVFPEKLCETPIKASSRIGDIVMDFLAGSGTVGVVAKKLGRRAILIDCVEEYCAISRERVNKVEYQPRLELEELAV
ncbi:hypothetical protein ES703_09381 [subsurface metagenome]